MCCVVKLHMAEQGGQAKTRNGNKQKKNKTSNRTSNHTHAHAQGLGQGDSGSSEPAVTCRSRCSGKPLLTATIDDLIKLSPQRSAAGGLGEGGCNVRRVGW